ncbi:MAG: DUF2249 domain-containing protein [Solirubrobacteraceae bacterium]|nr:DUF2249 domain-containing protein [Solirubrobacteraceae bacterium]
MSVQNADAVERADADEDQGRDTRDGLAALLIRATVALGKAGQPEEASRIAAAAWVALRHERPAAAQRINAAMHGLAHMHAAPTPTNKETPMPSTIDVRTEPPVRRHALIFDTFADLAVGDDFELVNDHDPKPLYYQLEAEHTGLFTWEYLEQGPEVWRVKIGRTGA